MLNIRSEPLSGLKLLRETRTVTELAAALTNGQRGRIREWLEETVGIGPMKREQVAKYVAHGIEEDFGAPVLWWNVEEEKFLDELRTWVRRGNTKEAQKFFYGALTEPGILRTCAYDAPEVPGNDHVDTLRRAVLNIVGMVVLRSYAVHYPLSKRPSAEEVARLSLHRARSAGTLARFAIEEQGSDLTESRKAQLRVIEIYIRINRVAIVSLFRESIAKCRKGVWFFPDSAVAEEVRASNGINLLHLLASYRRGHPDRFVVASNAVVFACAERQLAQAVAAWEIMQDECPEARDLAAPFATHERPLSDSPDLAWLIGQNGGSTILAPNSDVYTKLSDAGRIL